MNYLVRRQDPSGQFHLIAYTHYIEDAQAVLENWHSGYIEHRGQMVFKKNLKEDSNV